MARVRMEQRSGTGKGAAKPAARHELACSLDHDDSKRSLAPTRNVRSIWLFLASPTRALIPVIVFVLAPHPRSAAAQPSCFVVLREIRKDSSYRRSLIGSTMLCFGERQTERGTGREGGREGGCRAIRKDERNGRRKLKSPRREKRDYDRNDDEGRTSDCLSVNFILYTEKLT